VEAEETEQQPQISAFPDATQQAATQQPIAFSTTLQHQQQHKEKQS
jgi:hypothetical protein